MGRMKSVQDVVCSEPLRRRHDLWFQRPPRCAWLDFRLLPIWRPVFDNIGGRNWWLE